MSSTTHSEPVIDTKEWTLGAQKYTNVIARTTLHGTSCLVDQLHALFPFTPSSHAIDLGCGTGSLTVKIHDKCAATRVLATDIAEGMLEQVDQLKLKNVETKREDGATLAGLEDESFSHGASSFVAVQSLYRVVKPGGVVGIALWGARVDWGNAVQKATNRIQPSYHYTIPESPLAWRDETPHRQALEAAGLIDVRTETVAMPLEVEGGIDGVMGYTFRGGNPVMERMVSDFVAQGGDVEELQRVYREVLEEEYEGGRKVTADAVLGWGRKPGKEA